MTPPKTPARRTRTDRRAAERAAAKKAKGNGKPAAETAETAAPAPPATNGVFVAIARTDDGEGGIANMAAIPQGDVRAAEIPTILEKAVKIARGNLGLE